MPPRAWGSHVPDTGVCRAHGLFLHAALRGASGTRTSWRRRSRVGGDHAGAAILELDLRLDVLDGTAGGTSIQHRVLLGDELRRTCACA